MSRMRLISVAALASLSALAVGAPVASASHEDDSLGVAVCVFNGVSGQVVGGEDGVNSVSKDVFAGNSWDPLSLLDTDPGRFTFSGAATCTGIDAASEAGNQARPEPADGGAVPGVVPVTISAAGDYDNLICGTGTANGDAVVTSTGDNGAAIQVFTEFGIVFGVGNGVLDGVVDADPDETVPAPGGQIQTDPDRAEPHLVYPAGHSHIRTKDPITGQTTENQVDGGMVNGYVHIQPKTGDCGTSSVTQFDVAGAFEAVLSGEGSDVSTAGNPPGNTDSDA